VPNIGDGIIELILNGFLGVEIFMGNPFCRNFPPEEG
jgi:hypothetical protein